MTANSPKIFTESAGSAIRVLLTTTLAAACLCGLSARADNYIGNGSTSFSGAIGNGVLRLTDDGTNIYGTLYPGGAMSDVLVIYVDTGEAGGFSTTTNFNDQNDYTRQAIAGVSGGGRSTVNFMSGFTPKYAIALDPYGQYNNHSSYGGVWQLANGGNLSFPFKSSANLYPNFSTNGGPFTFSFGVTSIGLTNRIVRNVNFLATYVSELGYRSQETIGGGLAGLAGYNTFTQTNYASYQFANPATTNYALTFSVDMTAQIAAGNFKPASNDTVYVAGTFEANPWNFIQLFPTAGNPNLYAGTNKDFNAAGTLESYKYVYHRNGSNDVWESVFGVGGNGNRQFVTQSGGQTPLRAYFNNGPANPSATTNAVTFQIDMTAWINLGRFHRGTDLIEAQGLFQSNQWTAGFILTNNPTGANTNLYSGTYLDRNYPGTWEEYKFVIVTNYSSNTTPTYENGNNRIYYTPTNAGTLPVAFFNNISPYATPVTFRVDMTLPLLQQVFTNGETVDVLGTFQTNTWSAGFILTNNPSAANSNVYSGTYTVLDQPYSAEYYQFVISAPGGGLVYERPNNDRVFALGANSNAITLPTVFWSDQNPTNYTTQNTYVTFVLNMTNAVDIFSNTFDPANDLVFINGDFANPSWNIGPNLPYFWTDSTIDQDFPAYIMQNYPIGSLVYTNTFLIPAGHSLSVSYKYGIYHNAANIANTNVDNEAQPNLNHFRYVRATGKYVLPMDKFGQENTDEAGATEPNYGISFSPPAGGKLPISWLGWPGYYLQTSTNLSSGTNWINVTNVSGAGGTTNWPIAGGNRYFRIIHP